MVSTTHEKGVFLLQPICHAETPDQPGEGESFILLVEDDVPTLRLERVILEEAGYEVRVVRSGEEALQSLAEETPALNQSQGGNYILQRWQRHGRCKHQCVGSGL